MDLKEKDTVLTPATNKLLEKGNGGELEKERKEEFHSVVARGLFLAKRARPDVLPTILILATRVQKPNENDWRKLVRLIMCLNGTLKLYLTISIDNLNVIKWFIDASLAQGGVS